MAKRAFKNKLLFTNSKKELLLISIGLQTKKVSWQIWENRSPEPWNWGGNEKYCQGYFCIMNTPVLEGLFHVKGLFPEPGTGGFQFIKSIPCFSIFPVFQTLMCVTPKENMGRESLLTGFTHPAPSPFPAVWPLHLLLYSLALEAWSVHGCLVTGLWFLPHQIGLRASPAFLGMSWRRFSFSTHLLI